MCYEFWEFFYGCDIIYKDCNAEHVLTFDFVDYMENKLVSVIIPTKNSARTLEPCLLSLKDQSYQPIEIIVVDNSSMDETLAIANKYADKVFTAGPERSAQRNLGAREASGAYLLIHDSDIYFHVDSVKECVELVEKENCDAIILPEKSIGQGFWAEVKAFEREFYIGNDYIEAIRFFERRSFEELGGFDENLTGPEDWDLTIRFREAGKKIGRAQKLLEHDEGELSLKQSIAKKKYYSQDVYHKYSRLHPRQFGQQKNFFLRFPLPRILTKGLAHPILLVSMLYMKMREYLGSRPLVFENTRKIINDIDVNQEKKVTISIPTYNSGQFLALCLESIKKQTYKNIEINIVDGNSKDDTIAIAQSFGVSGIINYPGGLLEARYRGAKIANGDFVLLLDSDQILEPDCIARAVVAMADNDMLVLEEDVYRCENFIEKLFHYDRKLIHAIKDFDPMTSVMLPRFYKREILIKAFEAIPESVRESVGGQDHAIIYLEAWKQSQQIDLLPEAVQHIEPNSLRVLMKKFYRWGYTSVGARSNKYTELLTRKEKFRKGLFQKGLIKESLASVLLLIIKGLPYKTGVMVAKYKNK